MKTTIEVSDDLLERSRKLARQQGMTLRALVEEGLRLALQAHKRRPHTEFNFPVYGQGGLRQEFLEGGWERIRDEIYSDHGS